MILCRFFTVRKVSVICLVLFLFWSLVIFSKLEVMKELRKVCRRCRTVSWAQVGEHSELMDLNSFPHEAPQYVRQLTVVEDGRKVVQQDQFALKGLMPLKSIQKATSNVFFVESSCLGGQRFWEDKNGEFMLNPSQNCGVESMARANPGRPVYILHTCPLAEDFALGTSEYLRVLLELPNVFIVPIDPEELSDGWPDLLPVSSVSIGLLALWRFGGTYSALDVLVLRSLDPLGTDYCGFGEDAHQVGSGFFSFKPHGYGKYLVGEMLRKLSEGYESELWMGGTSFLPHAVDEECDKEPMMEADCNALTIYDGRVLLPVGPKVTELLLRDRISYQLLSMVKRTVYVINFFSGQELAGFDQEDLFMRKFFTFASEFCPNIYNTYNTSAEV